MNKFSTFLYREIEKLTTKLKPWYLLLSGGHYVLPYFESNKKLENDENYRMHMMKIEKFLKVRKLRHLSIEVEVLIFKTLAILKIAHVALEMEVSSSAVTQLTKIQKEFFWKN